MNDLTKEDLKLILQWRKEVKYTEKPTAQMIASNERLGEKIQSMIDNYCEHDWDIKIYNKQPGNYKCKKCGVFLND